MNVNIADLRKEYSLKALDFDHVHPDAMTQFVHWLDEALNSEIPEPTAMNLATVSPEGKPSARIVLLKSVDRGFVFFTNYESRKGRELEANPYACLTFFWPELERQVRIEGKIEKTEEYISDDYFKSRPIGSQIGAIASPQSRVIENRQFLEERISQLRQEYTEKTPARPLHWGGFRLLPEMIEFWQGRENRLHDRIRYTATPEGHWRMERLAP